MTRATGLAPALVFLATTGCVSLWTYDRPGSDDAETRRDMDQCQGSARAPRVPRPVVLTGAAITSVPYENVDRGEFDTCMRRKGYTRIVP
jgi:hypothetical protein